MINENDNAWSQFVKRHRNGETNTQVAKRVKVDPSTVGRWINALTMPTPTQAVAFARAYGSSPLEALLASGYLVPADIEGNVTIETTASIDAFSTGALLEELDGRLQVMSAYAGWIKSIAENKEGSAHLGQHALRYIDPYVPPADADPQPFLDVLGKHLVETEAIDGVPLYNVAANVGAPAEDEEDLHTEDLSQEQHDLAASDDDSVVPTDR